MNLLFDKIYFKYFHPYYIVNIKLTHQSLQHAQ